MSNSKNKNKENKVINKKKLLYLRVFSLFCVWMAVPVAFIMNYYGSFSYIPGYNYFESSGWSSIADQLLYFTIWSNIVAFFWVLLATLSSIFKDNRKLSKFIEYSGVKNTPLIMMFITMSVSFLILYPIIFIGSLKDHTTSEAILSILWISFLTPLLFQHLLVAIVLILDMVMTKGYKTLNNKKETKKQWFIGFSISSIIPLAWLLISIIAIAGHILVPQYPFMNLFPHSLQPDGTLSDFPISRVVLDWVTLICIVIVWCGYYGLISVYSNKKYKN